MRLAAILIIFSFVLLAVAALFDINYIDYKKPMPYSKWQKINFYDFKGFKKPGMTLDGGNKFAYIKTTRTINYLTDGNVEITTYFHPSRSYVFAKDIRNEDLLRHEIYHFHIAECFSRLLRQEIFGQKNITRKQIGSFNQLYYELEQKMQEQYDEDTYHSYVLQEQKHWETKVDSLLQSLEKFSQPLVRIAAKE
jgi:hypothetical protein